MIPGHKILHQIHSGSKTQVYRAIDEMNDRPVIIKVINDTAPICDPILQFQDRYAIANQLHHPQIIETYSLEPFQNSYALIMEDYGGMSLSEWLCLSFPSVESKLQIAIDLTFALQELARQQIIHKNINPTNILIHPVTQQVKIIDFGIASRLPSETLEIRNPNVLEGTLAYIAPEQTGRINRGIDYRCDFYSLGVTLYELFTEQLPFQAEDAIGWVYCHLTQIAVPAHVVNPKLPIVVSKIIAKLMAKNPEDRYQNAIGIKYDLDECLQQLQAKGSVAEWTIGQQDFSDRFLIPKRLYGREIEVQTLLDAFARVAQGSSELVLVAGCSGIGKTAVINEVHQPITHRKGYFITGKFDQFNRDLPLSAIVTALRDLIGQLLSDSELQLAAWNRQILAAVGDCGQVLIELIPELEWLIGQQPAAPKLTGTAAQNRFQSLFKKLIEVFTTAEHPLVMFLDDLQWADLASLEMIELLMAGAGYLLIVGAYRDNEVSCAHPLMLMVAELQQSEQIIETIDLQPLTTADIDRLVADTLHCTTDRSQPLTELIAVKTQGNPFFITQLLQALYVDGAIRFTPPSSSRKESGDLYPTPALPLERGGSKAPPLQGGVGGVKDLRIISNKPLYTQQPQCEELSRVNGGWECDMVRVKALVLSDNVVEFMVTQLQKLPPETQTILKLAACIGNSFALDTLAIITEQTPQYITTTLWDSLQAGLILPTTQIHQFFQPESTPIPPSPLYRFLHDRVQQAAYALIPAHQQQQTHLYIGRLLLANAPAEQKSAQLFEIVNHVNIAIALIQTQSEREVVARLNLAAAQKARAANAYTAAFNYAQIGIQLLGASAWEHQYSLALALHENLAEAALLSENIETVPDLVQVVFDRAQTPIDRVKSYETLVEFHTLHKQYSQAIDRGLEILQQLGIKLTAQPSKLILSREVAKTKIALWGKSNEQLLNLPSIDLPAQIAKLRILELLQDPAFFYSQELMVLFGLVGVQLTLRYGNSPWAASFYATYSICLSGLGEFKQTKRIGELAIMLADRFGNLAIMAQVKLVVALFCKPWQERFRNAIPMLDQSVDLAIASGNLSYMGINTGMAIAIRFYCGFPLDQSEI